VIQAGFVVAEIKKIDIYRGQNPREMPLYPVALAAKMLLLPLSTLKAWVFGADWHDRKADRTRHFEPLILPPENDEKLLSFVNLVEAHVLKAIRRKYLVQMFRTRDAIEHLKQMYETLHPLSDVDLYASGSDLFIREVGTLINITRGKQVAMREMLEAHLKRLDRSVDGLTTRLYPFVVSKPIVRIGSVVFDEPPKLIAIDPLVSFGRPVITGTGIPTEAIADRFWGGDSIDSLVEDFERSRPEIEYAIRYERAQVAQAA
jgi:uncharacterized protein (DUF433 family)